jgi:enoyl-CoA hydratase
MSDEVLFERTGALGLITLNRPRALNALNHRMVQAISGTLEQWARDDSVHRVALVGAGERGLCAGGDIVSIYEDAKSGAAGPDSESGRFWREEYVLNATIGSYPKPYIAIMDGIVMGGGVGLSAHGSHRVVTERSAIGMPETGIGFVPDVGGTYLLSRAPGEIGTHVALTTARLSAGDAVAAGLADHYVHTDRIPALLDALRTRDAADVLAAVAESAPDSALMADREWIDACYGADSVEEILDRLRAHPAPRAQQAATEIETKSPVALKVTLRALRRARGFTDLPQALRQEYRVSTASLRTHDLVEGIRAQVIDKDRDPHWDPATLAEVPGSLVETYFADLGRDEWDFTATEGRAR